MSRINFTKFFLLSISILIIIPLFKGCFFLGDEHTPSVTKIEGSIPYFKFEHDPIIKVYNSSGEEVQPKKLDYPEKNPVFDKENKKFYLLLPENVDYKNLTIIAQSGNILLKTWVPEVLNDYTVDIGKIDEKTTARSMIMEGKLALSAISPDIFTPSQIEGELKNIEDAFKKVPQEGEDTIEGSALTFFNLIQCIVSAGNEDSSGTLMFGERISLETVEGSNQLTGGLNQGFIDELPSKGINCQSYSSKLGVINSTSQFYQLLNNAIKDVEFSSILETETGGIRYIPVIITANMNEGTKDGNCIEINRYKWVKPDEGDKMFFTGGIHEESPIQNQDVPNININEMLGQDKKQGWIPNVIPMYDDGTHGDKQAGDGIWTIKFNLPISLRIGYKFTWGAQGEGWTGTEEWPGNRRILEIVDVNGDGLVTRNDNFGDEATNKDKVNLNVNGTGIVTWDTDVSGWVKDPETGEIVLDGIPDARERMTDTDGDCILDTW